MAFRKLDRKCLMFSSPDDFRERTLEFLPSSRGNRSVVLNTESLLSRSRKILDPRVIDLAAVIESGNVIDPTHVMRPLGVTDVADLDVSRERLGENMYNYILEHKDELVSHEN